MRSFSDKERTDTSGYFFIPTPNNYTSAQLLNEYLAISGDTLSSFVRTRQWTDSLVKHHHYEYQHYFMGIPVVAGIVREHFNKEGLYLIHGKVGLFDGVDTINMGLIDPPDFAVNIFLRSRFGYPADTTYYFAWQDTAWENQLKRDLEDSTATWFPTAKLVWVTPDLGYTPGPYLRNLGLAYEIRVFCLRPFFDSTFYVSAFRPWEVILSISNIWEHGNTQCTSCPSGYGPADVWYHGVRCIDTKHRGFPYNDYILKANDNGHNFHTKYFSLVPWAIRPEIRDKDNDWTNSHGDATSIHWFLQQSLDYFSANLSYNVTRPIRLVANAEPPFVHGTNFSSAIWSLYYTIRVFNYGQINDTRALDIIAHELCHAIIHETSKLKKKKESASIAEGFCDICGYIVENYVEGSFADWEVGEDARKDSSKYRSIANPKLFGTHADSLCRIKKGQADTYNGDYWYDFNNSPCQFNGIYTNSGPLRKWFYILSMGEKGINDHGFHYTVTGIGSNKAFKILFHAVTTYLTKSSTYSDLVNATITAEDDLFNSCYIEKQLRLAWNAVGLYIDTLPSHDCQIVSTLTPSKELLDNKCLINVYDIYGRLLYSFTPYQCQSTQIHNVMNKLLSLLPNGYYIYKIQTTERELTGKTIVIK